MKRDILWTADLENELGIARHYAYAIMKASTSPSTRLGHKYFIERNNLIKWLKEDVYGKEYVRTCNIDVDSLVNDDPGPRPKVLWRQDLMREMGISHNYVNKVLHTSTFPATLMNTRAYFISRENFDKWIRMYAGREFKIAS